MWWGEKRVGFLCRKFHGVKSLKTWGYSGFLKHLGGEIKEEHSEGGQVWRIERKRGYKECSSGERSPQLRYGVSAEITRVMVETARIRLQPHSELTSVSWWAIEGRMYFSVIYLYDEQSCTASLYMSLSHEEWLNSEWERAKEITKDVKQMVQLACEKFYREQKAPNLQVKANSIGVSQNSNRGEDRQIQKKRTVSPRKPMPEPKRIQGWPDVYPERFERAPLGLNWPSPHWATTLSLCLIREALMTTGRMASQDATNHEKLKLALLQRLVYMYCRGLYWQALGKLGKETGRRWNNLQCKCLVFKRPFGDRTVHTICLLRLSANVSWWRQMCCPEKDGRISDMFQEAQCLSTQRVNITKGGEK